MIDRLALRLADWLVNWMDGRGVSPPALGKLSVVTVMAGIVAATIEQWGELFMWFVMATSPLLVFAAGVRLWLYGKYEREWGRRATRDSWRAMARKEREGRLATAFRWVALLLVAHEVAAFVWFDGRLPLLVWWVALTLGAYVDAAKVEEPSFEGMEGVKERAR